MSSLPSRVWNIWTSSTIDRYSSIRGAFCFNVLTTLMVSQTLQFLQEMKGTHSPDNSLIHPFVTGAYYWSREAPAQLYWSKNFGSPAELKAFDLGVLTDAIRQLEIHTDIGLSYNSVRYLAYDGVGPRTPLIMMERMPFGRGVSLEVEERGQITSSIAQGDILTSQKGRRSQQYYSTGMILLGGEDVVPGLIDAAFMQFYLSLETLLESYSVSRAITVGKSYGVAFNSDIEKIVEHVFKARNTLFGHSTPKAIGGLDDSEMAFQIAKQTLVARWAARKVLELELGRTLACREMGLYQASQGGRFFRGDVSSLATEFALPA